MESFRSTEAQIPSDQPSNQDHSDLFQGSYSNATIHCADSLDWLSNRSLHEQLFDLVFLDPPFNQGKEYRCFDDKSDPTKYWLWMSEICKLACERSCPGASIYFMQREKNASETIQAMEQGGWTFQNLIVWKKKTSAIPSTFRFSKSYQIIVFGSKGRTPRIFNPLRIDPPLLKGYKPRLRGVLLTDLWDDIRELTSGYFAGKEVLRDNNGARIHKQQSPLALMVRIILASTRPSDLILDPFAGTGTTLVVARQLQRESIGIDVDPFNVKQILKRLNDNKSVDMVDKFKPLYRFTEDLDQIWSPDTAIQEGTVG